MNCDITGIISSDCSADRRGWIDRIHLAPSDMNFDPFRATLERHGVKPLFRDLHITQMEGQGFDDFEVDYTTGRYTYYRRLGWYVEVRITEREMGAFGGVRTALYSLQRLVGMGADKLDKIEDPVQQRLAKDFMYDIRLAIFLHVGLNPYSVDLYITNVTTTTPSEWYDEPAFNITVQVTGNPQFADETEDTVPLFSYHGLDESGAASWAEYRGRWKPMQYAHNVLIPPALFENFRARNVFPLFHTLRCQKRNPRQLRAGLSYEYAVRAVRPPAGDVNDWLNPKTINGITEDVEAPEIILLDESKFAKQTRYMAKTELIIISNRRTTKI